jgi:hypothetical protein
LGFLNRAMFPGRRRGGRGLGGFKGWVLGFGIWFGVAQGLPEEGGGRVGCGASQRLWAGRWRADLGFVVEILGSAAM